jgi:membrane protease subunit (stomatin/prohibitin family)
MAILGMGLGAAAGAAGALQQPSTPSGFAQQQQAPAEAAPAAAAPAAEDPVAKLTQLKALLDQGLITQEDFDAAKNKVLGL